MPITTQAIDNQETPLGDFLRDELRDSHEFMAASAFLNSGGLEIIEDELRRILESDRRVSIVHGADFTIADPGAIRTLVDMNTRYPQMSYRVHRDWTLTHSQSFHPKLYIARKDRRNYCAVIGSSNLTRGGLLRNTEVNAVIRGNDSDPTIRDCLNIYAKIHDNPGLIEPNAAFADKYEELYGRAKRLPLSDEPPSDIENLLEDLDASVRPANTRAPVTLYDYAVVAIMQLSAGNPLGYFDFVEIRRIAKRLFEVAGNDGATFRNNSFSNAVTTNIDNKKDLFERRVGTKSQYRLSEKGRAYARGLAI